MGQRGSTSDISFRPRAALNLNDHAVRGGKGGGKTMMHAGKIRAFDLDHLISVTLKQRSHLGGWLAPQNSRSANLRAVEMQDRQHSSVPHRIQERDALPGPLQRPGLSFPIADDGDRQQVGIVQDRSKGVHQHITQLTSLVDRSWCGDRHVARDPARSRELPEQPLDTGPILAHLGINLAVSAFQPAGRDQRRAAVPRASQIDRLLAGEANEPGDVDVNERKSGASAPMAKQPRLDVLNAERPLQQRVVFQVDLPDRQVVAGSPPRINGGQLAIGKSSKFVSGQLQGHTSSLIRDRRSIEGRRSLATLQAEPKRDPQALPGDFPPACRRRVAPYTAACVRRCMPSLVSRPDT